MEWDKYSNYIIEHMKIKIKDKTSLETFKCLNEVGQSEGM